MEPKKVQEFCKKAKKVVSKKNTLPILDCVLIKDSKMKVTNLDLTLEFYDKDLEGIEYLVELSFLSKIAQKSKEFIEIKNGKIRNERGTFSKTAEDTNEYPLTPEIEGKKDSISAIDIARIKKSANYTATDELRPVMNNVKVEQDNIIATNAHILAFHKRENSGDYNLFVSRKLSAVIDTKDYDVYLDENNILLTDGIYSYVENMCEGNFPAWDKVIPDKSTFVSDCKINSDVLKSASEDCSLIDQEKSQMLLYNDTNSNVLNIRADNIDAGTSFNSNIQVDNSGKVIFTAITSDLIKTIISVEKTKDIKFEFNQRQIAAIKVNNELILMPVELKDSIEPTKEQLEENSVNGVTKPKIKIKRNNLFNH